MTRSTEGEAHPPPESIDHDNAYVPVSRPHTRVSHFRNSPKPEPPSTDPKGKGKAKAVDPVNDAMGGGTFVPHPDDTYVSPPLFPSGANPSHLFPPAAATSPTIHP